MFDIGPPLKAPRSDWIQPIFYQTYWDTVEPALCRLVKDVSFDQQKVEQINDMLLVLIPKTEEANHMKLFRPISLCNVNYKVITTIVASRLKRSINTLVAPNQCSFVPSRNSMDNVVIAQEVFHSMRIKKGKKAMIAIKVDL